MSTAVGDEGGFAPNFSSNEECLNTVVQAIEKAGYRAGEDVLLALDCAASEFYHEGEGVYQLEGEGLKLTSTQFADYLANLCDKFPIVSIEDGMAEGDWDGWKTLTEKLGTRVQLVGDDLFVTNTKILKEGIEKGIGNSILIKINQIGTLTETFAAIEMAKRAGYTAVISHRSGEPKTAPLPTSPWAPTPDRSRPARCRARTAWPSTTSCCASRKTWAISPATRARARSTTCADTLPRRSRLRGSDSSGWNGGGRDSLAAAVLYRNLPGNCLLG